MEVIPLSNELDDRKPTLEICINLRSMDKKHQRPKTCTRPKFGSTTSIPDSDIGIVQIYLPKEKNSPKMQYP